MHEPICIQYARDQAVSDFEGQQREYPHKWTHDPVTYSVIRGTEDLAGESKERLAVNLAMTTWDIEFDIQLKWVPRDDNPDITIEWRDQEDDDLFKRRNGVLAYAYFPKTSKEGEIVFNDRYVWGLKEGIVDVVNPDGSVARVKQYNMIHTLIHEIGHSLGLPHSFENSCPNCVMHWTYNAQLEPQELDIERINLKYPKRNWPSRRYHRFKRWLARRKVRVYQ